MFVTPKNKKAEGLPLLWVGLGVWLCLLMQTVKSIDNQSVMWCAVQMWFKSFGNNFHVFGTKTDSKSLR